MMCDRLFYNISNEVNNNFISCLNCRAKVECCKDSYIAYKSVGTGKF